MKENESWILARHIMRTGSVIQDRIIRLHTLQINKGGKNKVFRDLTMAQLHTIMSIYKHGEISMTELSALTRVSPPSASAMVDRLVEKGILLREHSAEDRRKVLVKISPRAITGIKQFEESMLQSFAELVDKIGKDTAKKWCEVLDKIQATIDKEA